MTISWFTVMTSNLYDWQNSFLWFVSVDENRLSKFYTTFWNRKDCQVSWNSCFPFARLSVQKMDCHSWMLGLYDCSFYHICLLHFKLYFVRQQANILIPIDQFYSDCTILARMNFWKDQKRVTTQIRWPFLKQFTSGQGHMRYLYIH